MATLPKNAEFRADAAANSADALAPYTGPIGPGLHLFRFRLRQLLWFVSAICGLLAVAAVANVATTAMVILATAIVTAHVGSTVLGKRLRAHADSVRRASTPFPVKSASNEPECGCRAPVHAQSTSTPNSALHERDRSVRRLPTLILSGFAIGGLGGAALLAAAIGDRTSPAGIAVGGLSLAVVGAWCMFLAVNFCGIARHVVRQALAEQKKDEMRYGAH